MKGDSIDGISDSFGTSGEDKILKGMIFYFVTLVLTVWIYSSKQTFSKFTIKTMTFAASQQQTSICF